MRVRPWLMAGVLMFTSCSCTSRVQRQLFDLPPDITHYEIVFNSSITLEQEELIMRSVDAWSEVLGDSLTFGSHREEYKYETVPPPGEIRFWSAPGAATVSNIGGQTAVWYVDEKNRPYQSRIWIDTEYNDYFLSEIVTHELGHALGLKHSDDRFSIMYPKIEKLDVEHVITCQDRKNLCTMWNCDPGCM